MDPDLNAENVDANQDRIGTGKPGPDQWTSAEKIGIPTNIMAAAALL